MPHIIVYTQVIVYFNLVILYKLHSYARDRKLLTGNPITGPDTPIRLKLTGMDISKWQSGNESLDLYYY